MRTSVFSEGASCESWRSCGKRFLETEVKCCMWTVRRFTSTRTNMKLSRWRWRPVVSGGESPVESLHPVSVSETSDFSERDFLLAEQKLLRRKLFIKVEMWAGSESGKQVAMEILCWSLTFMFNTKKQKINQQLFWSSSIRWRLPDFLLFFVSCRLPVLDCCHLMMCRIDY